MRTVIRISEEAYRALEKISLETTQPISVIASTIILNKDKEIRLEEKLIKELKVK